MHILYIALNYTFVGLPFYKLNVHQLFHELIFSRPINVLKICKIN